MLPPSPFKAIADESPSSGSGKDKTSDEIPPAESLTRQHSLQFPAASPLTNLKSFDALLGADSPRSGGSGEMLSKADVTELLKADETKADGLSNDNDLVRLNSNGIEDPNVKNEYDLLSDEILKSVADQDNALERLNTLEETLLPHVE